MTEPTRHETAIDRLHDEVEELWSGPFERALIEHVYDAARSGEAEGRFTYAELVAVVDRVVCEYPPKSDAPLLRESVDKAVAALAEHPEPKTIKLTDGDAFSHPELDVPAEHPEPRQGQPTLDAFDDPAELAAFRTYCQNKWGEDWQTAEWVRLAEGWLAHSDFVVEDQPVDRASGEGTSAFGDLHVGRSWDGHPLEDDCPCPKELCGLVSLSRADPACEQHSGMKAIRQSHSPSDCPALAEHPVTGERETANDKCLSCGLPRLPVLSGQIGGYCTCHVFMSERAAECLPEPLQDGGEREEWVIRTDPDGFHVTGPPITEQIVVVRKDRADG